MVEFATALLEINHDTYDEIKFANCKHLNLTDCNGVYLVSGNIRAWRDFIQFGDCSNTLRELLLYRFKNHSEYEYLFYDIFWDANVKNIFQSSYDVEIVDQDNFVLHEDEEKRKHTYYHFRIITSRGVTHELVRHRLCSFAQESTRYCNYNNFVTFVYPAWYYKKPEKIVDKLKYQYNLFKWKTGCKLSEIMYKSCLKSGMSPQQARDMLNHATKTEINISANLEQYEIIFRLRSALSAHPDIRLVSNLMKTLITKE